MAWARLFHLTRLISLSVQSVTKERTMRLMAQHKDTTQLAQQIHHVLSFCSWAITTGSSTALLYSKRLVCFS